MGKKKKQKFKTGKYPNTVVEIATGTLFVRKSVTVNKWLPSKRDPEKKVYVRQRQIWRECTPPTAARAEELLKEIEAEIEFSRSGRRRPLTNFREIAEAFERVSLQPARFENGKKISGRMSLKTPRATVAFLKERFGHFDIGDITSGEIEDFKQELLLAPVVFKSGRQRQRAIRTVHYYLGFLRQIFNFAVRRGCLPRSPVDDLVAEEHFIDPAQETRRHVIWTRGEEAAALEFIESQSALYAHMRAVIICITDGGFRLGELLKVKWRDVDFERGIIPVTSYKGKNLKEDVIYMTDRMRVCLMEWKKRQKKIKKITDHSSMIGYRSVKHAWETIRAHIKREDLRLHDLRHVFGTRMAYEAKSPLAAVSKALRHSSVRTTEIYINVQPDDVRRETNKLNLLNEEFARRQKEEKEKAEKAKEAKV